MQIAAISRIGRSNGDSVSPPPATRPAHPTSDPEALQAESADSYSPSSFVPAASQPLFITSSAASASANAQSSSATAPASTPIDSRSFKQTAPSSSSPAQIASPVGSDQLTLLGASFSTTVSGKSYAGSVEESEGAYIASVPLPPGVSASGSSVQAAEDNLNVILGSLG